MSVLAVVSKAVFEKEARVGGRVVAVGETWPTELYASQNPGLEALTNGGALFLVTVRPGDQLWLVGVLEGSKKSAKGWRAAANTVAIRDITGLIPRLRFATGKGITAEPGKLGMSLQTPRQLTADDEALLRGGARRVGAKAEPSAERTKEAPAEKEEPAEWRLDGYRVRALSSKLSAKERRLLEPFAGLLEANDEDEGEIELADVVETASGTVVALYALWPVEAGALVEVASGEVLADVYEGYFDAHGDEPLRTRMGKAVEAAAGIRFRVRVSFVGGRDARKAAPPPPATPSDPAVLEEIRALHAELDRTKGKERDIHAVMQQIEALQRKVIPDALRPYPVLRAFELSEAQRAWLELVVDHYELRLDLAYWGLPRKGAADEESAPGSVGSPLSRMVGSKPPLPLDTLVDLEGKAHPLWAIVSDVVVGLRSDAAFVAALDAQSPEVRAGVWRQMACGEDHLDALHPRDKKEFQRGWADPKALDAARTKYVALVRAAFDRLGDRREGVAKAVLAEKGPQTMAGVRVRVAALDGLARLAKAAGGALDASYDAMIEDIAPAAREEKQVFLALFSELPPERAGELTGLDYFLVQAFPSESGMRRVVEQIATNEEWQFAKGSWPKLAAELAAKFPEAALPVLQAAKPRLRRHPDGLDKAIEAAEKAHAKVLAKAKKSLSADGRKSPLKQ
jgi:hypothetical protein